MRLPWALAFGIASLCLAALFFGVMLTGAATRERLAPGETAAGIDVPRIGTVGDYPDPAHRTVVNVTTDGRMTIEGRPFATYAAFLAELKTRGDAVPGEILPGTKRHLSDATVVLRCDGDLPWGTTQRFVLACSEALIWRIFLGVRHERDGTEGALAWFLPKDKGCEDPDSLAWRQFRAVPGTGGSSQQLAAALSDSPASLTGKLGVRVDVDPNLPVRIVLELVDVAIRSGAKSVAVVVEAPPPKELGLRATVFAGRAFELSDSNGPLQADRLVTVPSHDRVHGEAAVPFAQFELRRDVRPIDPLPDFSPPRTPRDLPDAK